MIYLYTTEALAASITNELNNHDRLTEWVHVTSLEERQPLPSADHIIIDERGIVFTIDWYNVAPPYLLPQPLPYAPHILLAIIYWRLANYEKTFELLEGEPQLLAELDDHIRLTNNVEIDHVSPPVEDYRAYHNAAVTAHYGDVIQPSKFATTKNWYEVAMRLAPNDELKAFTARHYAALLLDAGEHTLAEQILLNAIECALTEDARMELRRELTTILLARLTIPYDQELLGKLKETLWQCLQYYEQSGRELQAAMVLIDAAQVANYSESFTEALGYLARAINIFEQEQHPELLAQAHLQKGILLYTWAQQGNPQFYRGAMEALQEASATFTRQAAPDLFAEIHHLLGVIYAEIPDEAKKKSVWAAVSSSSFKEALNYYTRNDFPYEYATICTHFGNAYLKYPASRNSDNVTKALELFNEALSIRTAAHFPLERALTLLNFLEASWYADLSKVENPDARLADMEAKAREVFALTQEETLRTQARDHLHKIEQLKEAEQRMASGDRQHGNS